MKGFTGQTPGLEALSGEVQSSGRKRRAQNNLGPETFSESDSQSGQIWSEVRICNET